MPHIHVCMCISLIRFVSDWKYAREYEHTGIHLNPSVECRWLVVGNVLLLLSFNWPISLALVQADLITHHAITTHNTHFTLTFRTHWTAGLVHKSMVNSKRSDIYSKCSNSIGLIESVECKR